MLHLTVFLIFSFAALAGGIIVYIGKYDENTIYIPVSVFVSALPFAVGGFHSYTVFPICIYSVFLLLKINRINSERQISVRLTLPVAASAVLLVSSALTCFFAVDRGLAPYGLMRSAAIFLFTAAVSGLSDENRKKSFRFVPATAAAMTAATFIMSLFGGLREYLVVAERLGGTFEYPNAYSGYLLIALALSIGKKDRSWFDLVIDAALIFGVFESGSRTAFIILPAMLAAFLIFSKEKKAAAADLCILAVGAASAVVVYAVRHDISYAVSRFTEISLSSSTFVGRILYWKDALPAILKHPFGLGYMGYYYMQGSFQTGVYSVAFVHNGALQILLDYGFLPFIAYAASSVAAFTSKRRSAAEKIALGVLLLHSLFDFDLEFLSICVIGSLMLEYREIKIVKIKKAVCLSAVGVVSAAALWTSAADALYRSDLASASLAVYPFNTSALIDKLIEADDVGRENDIALKILPLNGRVPVAYSARANYFFSRGDTVKAAEYKEKAIECNRYSLDEYLDYITKLYQAMMVYDDSGDASGTLFCVKKIVSAADMLTELKERTSPLAYKIKDKPRLDLPDEYRELVETLRPYIAD